MAFYGAGTIEKLYGWNEPWLECEGSLGLNLAIATETILIYTPIADEGLEWSRLFSGHWLTLNVAGNGLVLLKYVKCTKFIVVIFKRFLVSSLGPTT